LRDELCDLKERQKIVHTSQALEYADYEPKTDILNLLKQRLQKLLQELLLEIMVHKKSYLIKSYCLFVLMR